MRSAGTRRNGGVSGSLGDGVPRRGSLDSALGTPEMAEARRSCRCGGSSDAAAAGETAGFGREGVAGVVAGAGAGDAGAQTWSPSSLRGTGRLQLEHLTFGKICEMRPGAADGPVERSDAMMEVDC